MNLVARLLIAVLGVGILAGCMTDGKRQQWIREGEQARKLLAEYKAELKKSEATIREAQAAQAAGTLDPAVASVLIADAKEQGGTYARLITSTKSTAERFEKLAAGKTWTEVAEGVGWTLLGDSPYAVALLGLIRLWRGPTSKEHKDKKGRIKDSGRVSDDGLQGASADREGVAHAGGPRPPPG